MSDTEYGKDQQEEDLRTIAQLVHDIGDVLLLEQEVKTAVEQEVARATADGVKKTKPLVARRTELMTLAVPVYFRLLKAGVITGKSLTLPSGTVSTRLATSTEVHDAKGLLKLMSRLGKLTKMSKRPPRTVEKAKLSELMEAEPDVAAKITAAGLAERITKNRFTVKPNRSKLTAEQDLGPGDRVVLVNPSVAS